MSKVQIDMGESGGISKIPFVLKPYSNRVIFSSQDCYVYVENGKTKIHYEYTCTGNGTDSGASIMTGFVLAKTKSAQTQGIPSNSNWIPFVSSSDHIFYLLGSYNNGTVYSVNEDVECDWDSE